MNNFRLYIYLFLSLCWMPLSAYSFKDFQPQDEINLSITLSATTPTCNGFTNGSVEVEIISGASPFTYSWSNGATTARLFNVGTGFYEVQVTDANGEMATASVTVGEPDPIEIDIATAGDPCVQGGTTFEATVTGGTGNYTFEWSNGESNNTITPTEPDVYFLTVTDENGCEAVQTVDYRGALEITVEGQDVRCAGFCDGAVKVNASGGMPPYTYEWNTGANTPLLFPLPVGIYTVTVTDANGCTRTGEAAVTAPDPIEAEIDISGTCTDEEITVTVTPSGGQGPYFLEWSTGDFGTSVTGLSRGETYLVNVFDVRNCNRVFEFTIPEEPALVIRTEKIDISCSDSNSGTATVIPISGTPPYSFLWNNGETTASIDSLPSGTYEVTVQDARGCETSEEVIIEDAGALELEVATVPATCDATNDGMANVIPLGGTPDYQYLWNDPQAQTTATAMNLAPGTYTVIVMDAERCMGTATVTVGVRNNIEIDLEIDSVAQVITANAEGGTPDYSFEWSNGSTAATLIYTEAIEYCVTVTDRNGCTEVACITPPPTEPLQLETTSTDAGCAINDGTATAIPTGGRQPYEFLWSNDATTATIERLAAGTYSVTVIDANNDTLIQSVEVLTTADLEIEVGSTQMSCSANDGSAFVTPLNGTAPYRYSWSNSLRTDTIRNLFFGTYRVTVTDARGCVAEETVMVDREAIQINARVGNEGCFGGTADGFAQIEIIEGTAPIMYEWETGGEEARIENLSEGTYNVIVTDANGCQVDTTITVIEQALSATTAAERLACDGTLGFAAVTEVQNATGVLMYEWNNSATTDSISELQAGTYEVTVTDENGCFTTASAEVEDILVLDIELQTTPTLCLAENGSIAANLNNGTAPYTYSWEGLDSMTSIVNNLPDGAYVLTVTDAEGCQGTVTTAVEVLNNLAIKAEILNTTCPDTEDGQIYINTISGTPNFDFNWSNGLTTDTITDLSPGEYILLLTDENGCELVDTFQVMAAPTIEVSVEIAELYCSGDATLINTVNNTPQYDLTYQWSPNSLFEVGTDTMGTPSFIGTETSEVSLVTTNQFGCQTVQNFQLNVIEKTAPDVSQISFEESCLGFSVNFEGGSETDGYFWRFGDPNRSDDISSDPNPTWSYSETGTFLVTLIPETTAFCRDTAQFEVEVVGEQALEFDVDGVKEACPTNTSELSVNDTLLQVFSWYNLDNPDVLLSNERNFAAAPGTYRVEVENSIGCKGSEIVVVEDLGVSIELSEQLTACEGETVTAEIINLKDTDMLNYSWSPDDIAVIDAPTSDMPVISVDRTTTFSVEVTNQFNCSISRELTVDIAPLPVVEAVFAEPDTINLSESTDLTVLGAQGAYTYEWSEGLPNSDNLTVTPNQSIQYDVAIISEDGCVINRSAPVVVLDLPCEPPYIYVPNALTPNGDGINDIIRVRGFHIERMYFAIFNRWGEKIFETTSQDESWDGTYKGEILEGRTYGYYVEVECVGGEVYTDKGNISIIR